MSLDFSKAGYIYLLTNESFDDMVKIGYTTNPPEHRANELYTTGVPTPYQVWDYWFVENAPQVEEDIHVLLFKNRSNKDREFFNINPNQAYKTIISCIESYRKEFLQEYQAKNYTNKDNHVHQNKDYSNPKFVELIHFLKENQGKLFSDGDLAKALNMKPESVNKLMFVMEKQETKIIHRNPAPDAVKKFGIYFKFGTTQLNVLKKKYPALDFSSLDTLFNDTKAANTFIKEKKESTNNNWLRVIQTLLVEDKHRSKKAYLSMKEIADKTKLSQEQVKQGIDYILNETGDDILFVIGKGEKQKFGIDFEFNEEKLKEILKNNERLLNSYKENIHQLKTPVPKKSFKKRKPQ